MEDNPITDATRLSCNSNEHLLAPAWNWGVPGGPYQPETLGNAENAKA
jgi:hypothetical protein